jgi:hypothetical protein
VLSITRQSKEVVRKAVARLEAKRVAEGRCKKDPTVRMSTPPGQREPDRVPHGPPGTDGLCDPCRKMNRESSRRYRERRRKARLSE